MSDNPYEFSSTQTLLDRALDLDYFIADKDGPAAIPAHRVDGEGKLVVVCGDNASGKSFFRRIITLLCRKNDIEAMHISMEGRRGISASPWLVFVYGDEETQATGVNSAQTVLGGIRTCENRDSKHVIFWDEPDLGLSDDWAAGTGQLICKFAQEASEHTVAAFVVSHRKALIRELLPAKPFYLHLGVEEAPPTLEAWLDKPVTPRDPNQLPELSQKRFNAIQAILRSKGV